MAADTRKWNVYVPEKFQSILGRALTILLEDPEYEKLIGVVLILKGTYFGKVDFINTFLMDFYLLLYISKYSGKTMEECNLMAIEMGKTVTRSPTTTTLLIVMPNYILIFKKNIYQLLKNIVLL